MLQVAKGGSAAAAAGGGNLHQRLKCLLPSCLDQLEGFVAKAGGFITTRHCMFPHCVAISRIREPPADRKHGHLFLKMSHLRVGQGFGAPASCCKPGLLGFSAKDWVEKYNAGSSELSDADAERLGLPKTLGLHCGTGNWTARPS